MTNAFNKGDVVVLKSGGPPMTVDLVPGETDHGGDTRTTYLCRWFRGANKEQGVFSEHLLESYVRPTA